MGLNEKLWGEVVLACGMQVRDDKHNGPFVLQNYENTSQSYAYFLAKHTGKHAALQNYKNTGERKASVTYKRF